MTRFWLSALVAAAGTAGLAAAALPLFLRLESRGWGGTLVLTAPEIWLLEVFTAGVLVLLLGLAGLGGGWFDARGVRDALEREEAAPEPGAGLGPDRCGDEGGGTERNGSARTKGLDRAVRGGPEPTASRRSRWGDTRPAWWLITVGGILLGIYTTGWLLLG